MGNVYLLYLEAKVREGAEKKERWKCINGYFRDIPYGKTEEVLSLSHLLVSGSRSYFGETYDELCEIGDRTPFTELSKEIQEEHPDLKFAWDGWTGEKKDTIADYVTVPVDVFRRHVPDGFQYHGIYHKNAIESFRTGETEEIWEDENVDFGKMDALEKQCYEYFEWDSPFGWQKNFKNIAERIDFTVKQYVTDTWNFENPEMRIVAFCL